MWSLAEKGAALLRPGLTSAGDKDASRREKSASTTWSSAAGTPGVGTSSTRSLGSAAAHNSSSREAGSRGSRAGSLEAGARDSLGPYREDDEGRFNFGGALGRAAVGLPGRATSLELPGGVPVRRGWDEPSSFGRAGRGPERSPTAARRDATFGGGGAGMRRGQEPGRGTPTKVRSIGSKADVRESAFHPC